MPSLKVLLIANACAWASWPDKIAAIKAFYAPLVELDIDIKYTDFQTIPTQTIQGDVTVFGASGITDTVGTDIDVSTDWLTENVSPLASGYDIVVFQTTTLPPQEGLPLGITIGRLNGVWTCMTFTTIENGVYELPGAYYTPPQTNMVNLGDQATIIIEHEISHALYELSGETDNTHKFFYSGQFSRVLTDIKLPNQGTLVSLYQQLVADLEAELGILKQQQSTADPNTPVKQSETPVLAPQTPNSTPPSPDTTSPSVTDLANFIKGYEGWCAPGGTLDGTTYPNGTISYQCNNPSNSKWAGQQYATARVFAVNGIQETFAAFDTYDHGWEYMIACLTEVVNGTDAIYNEAAQKLGLANSGDLTLDQFFFIRDNPSDDNDPTGYAADAGKAFGVDSGTFQMKQFTLI